MPRNGSGTFSLVAGNPVVSGTVIDSTWANDTLEDIANELTNSLSRTGAGGMLAPFRVADGTVAAPGLAFTNETNSGIYRSGAGELWLAIGGVAVAQITAQGLLLPSGKRISLPAPVNDTDAANKEYVDDRVDPVIQYVNYYLGPKSSDPAVNNSGGALTEGSTYWNTTLDQMRVYNGSNWEPMPSTASLVGQTFSGDGVEDEFTLANPSGPAINLEVFISGVRQVPTTDYTVSGTTLTFTVAPPSGTNNIFVRYAQLIAMASTDAQQVSYLPAGTGAVATNVQSKLREFVSVKDFGAIGDGVTDDRVAFTNAFAALDSVRLESGKTYWLGNVTSNSALFAFTGSNKIIDFNGAKVTVTTSGGNYNAGLFELDNIDGLTLINPDVQDLGFDQTATFKGITVIRFNVVAGPVRNIRVTGAKYENVVSSFDVINSAYTIENVWFDGEVKDSYYGLNFSNNGHYVTADYRTDNCIRSYYCLGVIGHNINCVSRNHAAASNADFLIGVTDPNKPFTDLKARFVSIDSLATANPQLAFQSINNSGTTVIRNLDIQYDDSESPLVTKSISFRHYLTAGGAIQATDPNQKGPIRIRGNITQSIDYDSAPASPQTHDFDYALSAYPSFLAALSSTANNVTGNGTNYTVIFNSENHDIGGGYNTGTGVFTAPRRGLYCFAAQLLLLQKTVAHTRVDLKLVTTSVTFTNTMTNSGNPAFPEETVQISVPALFMEAGQTARVDVAVFNDTQVVDVFGSGSSTLFSYFSGAMMHGMLKS